MQNLMEKAAKGYRLAIEELLDKYKTQVTSLCKGCLGDTDESYSAVVQTFGSAWSTLLKGGFKTEDDFKESLLKSAAIICRKKFIRKGAKSLPVPQNKNFLITGKIPVATDDDSTAFEQFLNAMPGINRYLFVLHRIAGLDEKKISSITGYKMNIVTTALDAEEQNNTRIISQIEAATGEALDIDGAIDEFKSEANLPDSVLTAMHDEIGTLVKPCEKSRKKKKIWLLIGCVALAAILIAIIASSTNKQTQLTFTEDASVSSELQEESNTDTEVSDEEEALSSDDADVAESIYTADIEVKDYGTITVELDGSVAPVTVENFVTLANSGFYDGLTFHRIMDGFMIQGGDPDGNGTGGSDQTITGEFSDNGYENSISHTRGVISMARSSDYDSASSQFFIVQSDSTFLDGQYAAFGHVTEGMDVVDAICADAEPTDDNGTIPAEQQPVITSITIRESKGDE